MIVTDLMLPTARAREEMIAALRAACPGVRVIVLTGFSGELDAAIDTVLRKPVRTERLLQAIAKLVVCLTLGTVMGTIVQLQVDRYPPFHLNLFAGNQDRRYPVFLGAFPRGGTRCAFKMCPAPQSAFEVWRSCCRRTRLTMSWRTVWSYSRV